MYPDSGHYRSVRLGLSLHLPFPHLYGSEEQLNFSWSKRSWGKQRDCVFHQPLTKAGFSWSRAVLTHLNPLLCEASPGTGPTTSPNTHLYDALQARLHATLAWCLTRHLCITAGSRIRRTCKVVHTVDVQALYLYARKKDQHTLLYMRLLCLCVVWQIWVIWSQLGDGSTFQAFAGSVSRLSITSLKLVKCEMTFSLIF